MRVHRSRVGNVGALTAAKLWRFQFQLSNEEADSDEQSLYSLFFYRHGSVLVSGRWMGLRYLYSMKQCIVNKGPHDVMNTKITVEGGLVIVLKNIVYVNDDLTRPRRTPHLSFMQDASLANPERS